MSKFNTNNFKNKMIKTIIISLLIYSYYYIITNTNFISIAKKDIEYKYNNAIDNSVKINLVYKSLNKIIDINDIKLSKTISNEKKVLIYNTHESEKYNLPFASDYSIIPDVSIASKILKEYLNNYNINSYIETRSIKQYLKDNKLGYSDSYEASRVFLKELIPNNYKLIIDIHRDSLGKKYTLYQNDNKNYARILFVIGLGNKNYKENEEIANILNNKLNNQNKGISRGIVKKKDITYNQDLNDKILLLKIGGIDSTIEEVNNTLEILAKIINEYIKES